MGCCAMLSMVLSLIFWTLALVNIGVDIPDCSIYKYQGWYF
jgi:hypothetical protein